MIEWFYTKAANRPIKTGMVLAYHSPMNVIAVITDPAEVKKILRHLVKIGRSPPGLDPSFA